MLSTVDVIIKLLYASSARSWLSKPEEMPGGRVGVGVFAQQKISANELAQATKLDMPSSASGYLSQHTTHATGKDLRTVIGAWILQIVNKNSRWRPKTLDRDREDQCRRQCVGRPVQNRCPKIERSK
jgi:hypothetical protein